MDGAGSGFVSLLTAISGSLSGGTIVDVQAGAYVGLPGQTGIYNVNSNGTIQASNGSYQTVGNWITPTSLASGSYEIYVSKTSGSLTAGTLNTWLALSSTYTWVTSVNASATLSVSIRKGTTVLDTGTVFISGGGPL